MINGKFMFPIPFHYFLNKNFRELLNHNHSRIYLHSVSNATVSECFGRGFDDEMRAVVARNLEGRGINLHPRTCLTKV